MRCWSVLAILVLAASGCTLFEDDGDDACLLAEAAGSSELAPAPQRNPELLTCETFGNTCDERCGPCPAASAFAPESTWGICSSSCEALDEETCEADPACRVVKYAACAIDANCETDFLGCFPTDSHSDISVDCFAARDGWTCSRSNACTALHGTGSSLALEPELQRPFALCVPEGKYPGRCVGRIDCGTASPACPPNSTPGIADGCYTGACIPNDLCAPTT